MKSLNYLRTGREQVLKPFMDRDGYLTIRLCKYGKHKAFFVHRLVAIAFIPIPEHLKHIPIERLEVNHKDEDKTNNCVWNLEWCDSKYNRNYGTRNKRMSEAKTNGKTSKPVLQLDKDTGEIIREWPSTMEVQRQLGFAQESISDCCLGKYKQSHGFKWKYA